jgi:hypothetical protein
MLKPIEKIILNQSNKAKRLYQIKLLKSIKSTMLSHQINKPNCNKLTNFIKIYQRGFIKMS